jgi:dihydroorotase
MRIELRGGRAIDPASGRDEQGNVYIADGRVIAIGQRLADFEPERVVDATGCVVCPGLIELGSHVGEPGEEHRGTIRSESRAAVAGGITTMCIAPDTTPVIDSPAVVELLRGRADDTGLARIEILGALTAGLGGERLAEMYALKNVGCLGMTNSRRPIADTEVMRRALDYAVTFDLTVFLHCQDPWLARDRLVHSGPQGFEHGLDAIPEAAETVAVARDLLLVEQTGTRAHFCRLSTARAVTMVAEARSRGLPVSADVGVPYLFLTTDDIDGFDARCHVTPPLRSAEDRDGLSRALADGTLQAACADHQPQGGDAKLNPFPMTSPGISGLETLLPLILAWSCEQKVDLPTALATVTTSPAQILGLNRGTLAPGEVADICMFDPNAVVTIDASTFESHGKNTPFDERELAGKVRMTLVDGNFVYEAPQCAT